MISVKRITFTKPFGEMCGFAINTKMKKLIYLSAGIMGILMASCGNSEKQNQAKSSSDTATRDTGVVVENENTNKVDTADLSFFKNAAIGGLTEVEASSRMLIVSKDSAIRTFARIMVDDHTKVNSQLTELAKHKGLELPKVLSDRALAKVRNIDSYKDDGRNEYYAHLMATDHKQSVDLFNTAANSKDKNISSFAKQTLSALLHHYKMAKDLEAKITAHKTNQGDDPLKLSNKEGH